MLRFKKWKLLIDRHCTRILGAATLPSISMAGRPGWSRNSVYQQRKGVPKARNDPLSRAKITRPLVIL